MSRNFEVNRVFYPYNIHVDGDEICIEQFDNTSGGSSVVMFSVLQSDVFLYDIQMAIKAAKERKEDTN